jgi:hypothetical protein
MESRIENSSMKTNKKRYFCIEQQFWELTVGEHYVLMMTNCFGNSISLKCQNLWMMYRRSQQPKYSVAELAGETPEWLGAIYSKIVHSLIIRVKITP